MTQCLQILKTGFFSSTIPSNEQHSVHPEQVRSLPLTSLPLAAILIGGPCFITISLPSIRATPELTWLLGSRGASRAAVNKAGRASQRALPPARRNRGPIAASIIPSPSKPMHYPPGLRARSWFKSCRRVRRLHLTESLRRSAAYKCVLEPPARGPLDRHRASSMPRPFHCLG